jgi:deoxyribonuclease V
VRYGAVDVHYPPDGSAVAALVVAPDPRFAVLVEERTVRLDVVADDVPGDFKRRELPALLAVLAAAEPVDLLVVDGYVTLDPAGRAGLGAAVHEALGVPVVGVAKTFFREATHALPVLRGEAVRPLLVTAAGMPVDDAATLVRAMAGLYRLPDALRRVDRLARSS